MKERKRNRSIHISLVAVLLLIAGCVHHHDVAQGEQSDEQQATDPKYQLTPTPDAEKPGSIYIPKNIDDCFVELKRMLHPDFIDEFKESSEEGTAMHHFGLGMWMRSNWGLWGGSRLAKWFNAQGIEHPDDMSGIILNSFWHHLNGHPIKLDEQIAYYKQYWLKATPPKDPCPHCGSELHWIGGGGDSGHGLECEQCQRGFHYHYQSGLRQVAVSRDAAREKAETILRERQISTNVVVMENKLQRFKTFAAKKYEGCNFTFGMAGFGMGWTNRLVWQFAWRGQDIEQPLDNLMWIEIDAETGHAKIWFAVLKSEEIDNEQ